MGILFTREQLQVIESRDKNLLVAAAAGSGKTAVLTERIIQRICDKNHPIDIDHMLIVTFTNAAAAEMRERIQNRISEKLEENPDDIHLQKQITLVHSALITTIDSFCLYLLRNNFNEVGVDPNFRVADEGELKLLQKEAMDQLLEAKFAQKSNQDELSAFLECVEWFCAKGKDDILEEYIYNLHNYAMSNPWPIEWLEARKEDYHYETIEELCKKDWMQFLFRYSRNILESLSERMQDAVNLTLQPDGPYMYGELFEKEKETYEVLAQITDLPTFYEKVGGISFETLSRKKDDSVNADKRAAAKAIRDEVKEQIKKLQENFFDIPLIQDVRKAVRCRKVLSTLIDLAISYTHLFAEKKREKNIIDFQDMEHFALEILWDRQDGVLKPSKSALEYKQYFEEIMIDEYQDSNLVQEYLLKSIAKSGDGVANRFMVGDVKQSIYRFRLARPDLFLEKYLSYRESDPESCVIDLHQNFRSRREVIDSVNQVFSQTMGEKLGGIAYDDKAGLVLGATYPEGEKDEFATQLLLIDEVEKSEDFSKKELEAYAIAGKIKKIVKSGRVTDKETGELRQAAYKDIVILLRSNAGWDQIFKEVLVEQGIPAFVATRTGYFSAKEVQTLLQFLRVLDNPMQDIPLYGVLRSVFGSFSEEEIVQIKLSGGKCLYEQLRNFCNQEEPAGEIENTEYQNEDLYYQQNMHRELVERVEAFLNKIEHYRKESSFCTVQQLLIAIMEEHDYVAYMSALPAGEQRRANIEMFLKKAHDFEQGSFYGLFHFIRYMEQLEKFQVDYGEANILDENSNVVRIMSIHKSKGLEFPIVFLAGMNKKFNMMDVNTNMVMDTDYGMGFLYVDAQRRTQGPTLRKRVLSQKIHLENLAEELRVLYVAMTRAKEKLYICGSMRDVPNTLKGYMESMQGQAKMVPYAKLVKCDTFYDFLLLSCIRHPMFSGAWQEAGLDRPICDSIHWANMKYEILTADSIMAQDTANTVEIGLLKQQMMCHGKEEGLENAIKEKLSFRYGARNLEKLFAKTTVSELKMEAIEEKGMPSNQMFETHDKALYIPSFVREEEKISGTVRGNAYHRVMELLDFTKPLQGQLEQMEEKGLIPTQYKDVIRVEKIQAFLQSELGKRMKVAQEGGKLYREQPFVYGIAANRLSTEFPASEKVLIQGIIDAYFIEDDEIVVLDYKTDRIREPKELVDRYETQLRYYTESLEKLVGKRVKEKLLYSFSLSQTVECPCPHESS